MGNHDSELDEILGITRCDRCGQRLEGEIECPFCTPFEMPDPAASDRKWIYFTACFLTSPLSIPFILSNETLKAREKILAASGMGIWGLLYWML